MENQIGLRLIYTLSKQYNTSHMIARPYAYFLILSPVFAYGLHIHKPVYLFKGLMVCTQDRDKCELICFF